MRRNLVLLTRPYPDGVTGEHGTRLYLQPSAPIPIERWDYTERAGVEETLALGRADAARYRDQLQRWLSRPQPSAAN